MVKQIIEKERHLNKFRLSVEEKQLFFDAVNMLPEHIYIRDEQHNVSFLKALSNNDLNGTFEAFQKITWKDVAKRLIDESKRVSKEDVVSLKQEKVNSILKYALTQ